NDIAKFGRTKKTTSSSIITIARIKTKNLVEEKSNAVTNMLIKKTINHTVPNIETGPGLKN
ncbi:unnamed protein product, partial [marine sediment metagenome]